MPREKMLSLLAALVCLIFVLHVVAIFFHLYWTLWWYDIILHFLGGVFLGLLVLWLRFFSGYFGTPPFISGFSTLLLVLSAAFFIGLGWEVFERMLGNTWSVEGYYLDTATDIVFDVTGALASFYLFKKGHVIQKEHEL